MEYLQNNIIILYHIVFTYCGLMVGKYQPGEHISPKTVVAAACIDELVLDNLKTKLGKCRRKICGKQSVIS